eukprot:CAMPEP_0171661652 /NCGR_PEP_ID=MMETSP0990-20121206/45060_1 /TAXON_ID=483369 /ORGANISM="non described non described, Strain CCMP2098" /LENGTH=126 /DNA_ID=CAMNT_0012243869 /DNA_START=94 /DNA_END=470 /DNA_ORIENTATION=-
MCSASTAVACACAKGPPVTASSPTSLPASPPPPLLLPRAWRAICHRRRRAIHPAPPPAPALGSRARLPGLQRALPDDHSHNRHMRPHAHSHIDHILQERWLSPGDDGFLLLLLLSLFATELLPPVS